MRKLLLLLCFPVMLVHAQKNKLQPDPETAQMILQGKRFLESQNYFLALEVFQAAATRPFSQSTTAAEYLTSITYWRMTDTLRADSAFRAFKERYPKSTYLPEVDFHLAKIDLYRGDVAQRNAAFWQLVNTAQMDSTGLSEDALVTVRKYLFYGADLESALSFYELAPDDYRLMFLEAACFQMVQAGRKQDALYYFEEHLFESDSLSTPFLNRLLSEEQQVRFVEPNISKVALMLPLGLDSVGYDSLGRINQAAVQFYEGFQFALDEFLPQSQKNIFVKVLDTRRDSATIAQGLAQLDSIQPDLVVGGLTNGEINMIGDWADWTGTPQLIPISPKASLVENRDYVYLSHPTAEEHGENMAEYAWETLGLNKVAVWTDLRAGTERLAQAFEQTFDTLGGEVIVLEVDSNYTQESRSDIRDMIRELKFQQADGVYIPILNNQETAGLILSLMRSSDVKVKVMGGPHWFQKYKNVDRDMLEAYNLLFSTGYMLDKEHPEYVHFFRTCLEKMGLPPTQYQIHGYDLGRLVVRVLDAYDPTLGVSFNQFLRDYPAQHGLHISFDFGESQSNEFVNICEFRDGKIVKVNDQPQIDLRELFQSSDQ
ncbi:ABC transporter substrate-binding protein [Pontibacter sp. G13]|uniref:ABC transporter substrate-binding protein n=1 Tax=Pontibacter sp. G13 TaxID=3074898 RepID=UPI00288B9A00|nr:penicillin-binding protein activator [Pontibacter sp. G13]WNJ20057.1 penicillin-binding protein activator [Pontibacter sp. G13]